MTKATTIGALTLSFLFWFPNDTQAEDQVAKETLQKAIKATGARFGGVRGPIMWMERGTYFGNGDGIPYVAQYSSRWPDWYRHEIEGVFTVTHNKDQAWIKRGEETTPFKGEALKELHHLRRLAWATRLFPLNDNAYQLTHIPISQSQGKKVVGLHVQHRDGTEFKLYFDEKTYLLTKAEAIISPPWHNESKVLAEAYFIAHQSIGGAKMPSKTKLYYNQKLYTESEIVAVKTGATLDPALFTAPE